MIKSKPTNEKSDSYLNFEQCILMCRYFYRYSYRYYCDLQKTATKK